MATYSIIIKNGTGGGSSSPADPASPKQKTAKEEGSKAKKIISAGAMYGIAKQTAVRAITHQINTVALRTGKNELQQRLQFQYNVASQTFSIAENIIIGAKIGQAPGAIVAAAVSIGSKVMDYTIKSNELRMARQLEDVQIGLADIRAGSLGDRMGRNV